MRPDSPSWDWEAPPGTERPDRGTNHGSRLHPTPPDVEVGMPDSKKKEVRKGIGETGILPEILWSGFLRGAA